MASHKAYVSLLALAGCLFLPTAAASSESNDDTSNGDTSYEEPVCECDDSAPASDFDRAIVVALRAQSEALSEITPSDAHEVEALWSVASRFERIALRIVAARTAYYASISCGSPASQFDAVLELMAEALREVRIIERVVGDSDGNLGAMARKSLARSVRRLERDLAVEASEIGPSKFCGHGGLDTPQICSGVCRIGQTCQSHPRFIACLCQVECPKSG